MSKIETIRALPDSQQLELVKAINELSEKAGQIDQILVQFENINQAQRQSIQALAQEISSETTTAIQQQLLLLSSKTESLNKTLQQVTKAAEFMEKAQKPISESAWKAHNAAQEIQKQPWNRLLIVVVSAAILASLLTLGGMHGLRHLQQKPATNDMQLQQLLDRATPAEQNLMLEIYKRPSK